MSGQAPEPAIDNPLIEWDEDDDPSAPVPPEFISTLGFDPATDPECIALAAGLAPEDVLPAPSVPVKPT